MIQAQYQNMKIQWDALRAAIARLREQDKGLATLEVVIIAGGLAVLAVGLIAVISSTVTSHKASIS